MSTATRILLEQIGPLGFRITRPAVQNEEVSNETADRPIMRADDAWGQADQDRAQIVGRVSVCDIPDDIVSHRAGRVSGHPCQDAKPRRAGARSVRLNDNLP